MGSWRALGWGEGMSAENGQVQGPLAAAHVVNPAQVPGTYLQTAAAVTLQPLSLAVTVETGRPEKPKMFAPWTLREKACRPQARGCSRGVLGPSLSDCQGSGWPGVEVSRVSHFL